jgi:hypothetical protein
MKSFSSSSKPAFIPTNPARGGVFSLNDSPLLGDTTPKPAQSTSGYAGRRSFLRGRKGLGHLELPKSAWGIIILCVKPFDA